MAYFLEDTTLLEWYLDRYKFPIVKPDTPTVVALLEIDIVKSVRLDSEKVKLYGNILILVKKDDKYTELNEKVTLDVYSKEDLGNLAYSIELNNVKNDFEMIDKNLIIATGKKGDLMWDEHLAIKRNVFPEDDTKYKDIPQKIRIDLERVLKSYESNKAFKSKYDKIVPRFKLLAKDLVAKQSEALALTDYKGMPVLYVKGENEYVAGKHRIYMTPTACYSISKGGYLSKFYDLRSMSIRHSIDRFNKFEPRFYVIPAALPDLKVILEHLNLNKKLPIGK